MTRHSAITAGLLSVLVLPVASLFLIQSPNHAQLNTATIISQNSDCDIVNNPSSCQPG